MIKSDKRKTKGKHFSVSRSSIFLLLALARLIFNYILQCSLYARVAYIIKD